MYCLFGVVLCIVYVYMCTVLLPPGGYPTAGKYIISYQHKNFGRVRAVPRLCVLYPGICLTTEEKARQLRKLHKFISSFYIPYHFAHPEW